MRRVLFAAALLLAAAVPASAQEAGQAGLTIGFPGSIGFIWHASDTIAIRPDCSFTHASSESGSEVVSTGDQWGVGFGVSANFYVGKIADNVRTYVTPRFAYNRTSTENATNTTSAVASKSHANNYQYAGAFGVQHTPTRRFSVFGEAGVQYTRGDSEFTATGPFVASSGRSTNSNFGTRAGVGLVLYFR